MDQTLYDFLNFIDENKKQLCLMNGVCTGCIKKRKCKNLLREDVIRGIIDSPSEATAHPYIKKYIIDIFPFLLYLIPNFMYRKHYTFDTVIECPFYAKKVVEHIEDIKRAYSLLSDDYSRHTLLNVLLFRCTFDRKYIHDVQVKESEYFISDFINLSEEEVFVDCGAFTGDTLEEYLKYNKAPKRYYLYEADVAKKEVIQEKIHYLDAKDFAVLRLYGVSDTKKVLHFCNTLGEGSSLKYSGDSGGGD